MGSKLAVTVLPALFVSTMGIIMLGHLAAPKAKPTPPAAIVTVISDDKLIEVTRAQPLPVAVEPVTPAAPAKLAAEDKVSHAKTMAVRKPKPAETIRAATAPATAPEKPGEPLALSQVAQAPAQTAPQAEDRSILGRRRSMKAAMAGWLPDDTPPRPPLPLPEPAMFKASM